MKRSLIAGVLVILGVVLFRFNGHSSELETIIRYDVLLVDKRGQVVPSDSSLVGRLKDDLLGLFDESWGIDRKIGSTETGSYHLDYRLVRSKEYKSEELTMSTFATLSTIDGVSHGVAFVSKNSPEKLFLLSVLFSEAIENQEMKVYGHLDVDDGYLMKYYLVDHNFAPNQHFDGVLIRTE